MIVARSSIIAPGCLHVESSVWIARRICTSVWWGWRGFHPDAWRRHRCGTSSFGNISNRHRWRCIAFQYSYRWRRWNRSQLRLMLGKPYLVTGMVGGNGSDANGTGYAGWCRRRLLSIERRPRRRRDHEHVGDARAIGINGVSACRPGGGAAAAAPTDRRAASRARAAAAAVTPKVGSRCLNAGVSHNHSWRGRRVAHEQSAGNGGARPRSSLRRSIDGKVGSH